MATTLVTARKPVVDPATKEKVIDEKTGKQRVLTASMEYNFGASLQESVELFGEAPVHSAFVAASIVSLQGNIRSGLDRGEDEAAIRVRLAPWKPGVTMHRVSDPIAALKAQFASGTMTEEEKRAKVNAIIEAAGLKKA